MGTNRFHSNNQPWSVHCTLLTGVLVLILTACSPFDPAPNVPTVNSLPSQAPIRAAATVINSTPSLVTNVTESSPEAAAENTPLLGPLSVVIISPEDGAEVQTSTIELLGEADPETVVSIDDQIIVVDAGRKFSVSLSLTEGPNVIEITASDPDGNQATFYLTLFYEP